jgi:hypothetical protein
MTKLLIVFRKFANAAKNGRRTLSAINTGHLINDPLQKADIIDV